MADGLRRLDGVASVEVDLQQNLCTITPDPERLLALDGVPAAVREAGYRVGRMWIEASGEVAVLPGSSMSVFRIDGNAGGREWAIPGAQPGPARITARLDEQRQMLVVESPP